MNKVNDMELKEQVEKGLQQAKIKKTPPLSNSNTTENKISFHGNSNQQANGNIVNIGKETKDPTITEAQAFTLRELVIQINESYQDKTTSDHKINIWNKLHDYCQTPAPDKDDRRSRYRLIQQSQYYRAISFLQKMLIKNLKAQKNITDVKRIAIEKRNLELTTEISELNNKLSTLLDVKNDKKEKPSVFKSLASGLF